MKTKRILAILNLLTFFFLFSTFTLNAQNVVITDDDTYTSTSTNALLEVKPGSNDKGVLLPRLTTTERTAITTSAAADKGLLVYDTNTKSFWYYDGTAWVEIGATSSGMSDADGDTKIQVEESADEDNIRFDISGTEAMVIDENAKVGIGTETPGAKLEIAKVASSDDEDALKIGIDGEYNASIKFFDDDAESTQHYKITYGAQHQDLIFHSDQEDNILYLTQDGKVGIGTNTPSDLLDINQSCGFYDESLDQENTNSNLTENVTGRFSQQFIANLDGYLSKIHVWDAGQSNGTFTLIVYPGIYNADTIGVSNSVTRSNSSSGFVTFNFQDLTPISAGTKYTFRCYIEGGDNWNVAYKYPYYSTCYFSINGNGTTSQKSKFKIYIAKYNNPGPFVVKDNGNVGVGIDNPSARLEINGTLKVGEYLLPSIDGANGQLLKTDGSGTLSWNADNTISYWSEASGNIYRSTGNIGIGTTNPTQKLEVNGNILQTDGDYTATDQIRAINADGLKITDDGDAGLFIADGGNVGIGTNSPQAKLHIKATYPGWDKQIRLESQTSSAYSNIIMDDEGVKFRTFTAGDNFYFRDLDNTTNLFIGDNDRVGIGTASPDAKLEVNQSENNTYTMRLFHSSSVGGSGLLIESNGGNSDDTLFNIRANIDQTPGYVITVIANGRVGIGTNNPSHILTVVGDAAKPGGGLWSVYSDIRLKDIHKDYDKGLYEILKLRPVIFNYKKNNPKNLPDKSIEYGFIAQEVQQIFPEAVKTGQDGYLDLNLHPINVAFVNAFKELHKENEELRYEIAELKSLKSEVEQLKTLLDQTAKHE